MYAAVKKRKTVEEPSTESKSSKKKRHAEPLETPIQDSPAESSDFTVSVSEKKKKKNKAVTQ